jgi:hypothetical protein
MAQANIIDPILVGIATMVREEIYILLAVFIVVDGYLPFNHNPSSPDVFSPFRWFVSDGTSQ